MIPSPPISSLSLGPLTVHFYAICILAGIGFALWWATKRWVARGGDGDDLFDIVFVAVIAGIVGSRVWHVLTSPAPFFGPDGNPLAVFYIWQGGLAIYGGVAGGAIAVWIMARVKKVSFTALADTIGPTIMAAQILGRFGNWFNQELYGPELDAWWAWDVTCVTNGQTIGGCEPGMYHPTFLYEQLWNLVGLAVLLLLSRRFQWAGGRVFWAYVAIYSVGRAGIDAIRTEPVLMVGPLRIHTLVAILTALVAIGVFTLLTVRKQRRGGEVVAADGSFELSAQTAGNGPDEDEVEKSGTPPSTGDDPAPGP
ncbi:prolipoprotein diacylglyceryl transferase [Brachybacterium sp. JB7]|uniref:Phosphatidylglycerol--prolipoprotein diacylglyceryl transferase n=1 Tax=Brachybacterium alimentarium TaxID=47845 RepID=A0A2A3YF59_9MICO|nr:MULTISPECIES: prolipoprotein diacylglyceryl transferase [Brachybacterium]PCC37927.1 prolipoprotein diacylglyceryl transferase [Brachybacterium alimentarium]RCS67050.1 prolipoprotein diacylglyceryl transferase [Brachybacterium sp. JB7]RCS68494.1 prolipoprotein diacylglyceryl transferase [Brachybacterium alimentarium]RCS76982.1 prolipoprotein diacylglyceryl transferase [Brachybacterium alimentarium]RCS84179.1 prolipoprotein diacylglyceryl transferase [Brachybacterium alimentarium]